jgi:hypothetical protein
MPNIHVCHPQKTGQYFEYSVSVVLSTHDFKDPQLSQNLTY